MSNEMMAQALNDTAIVQGGTFRAFAETRVAKVFPAVPEEYCTSCMTRIHGCRPGCNL